MLSWLCYQYSIFVYNILSMKFRWIKLSPLFLKFETMHSFPSLVKNDAMWNYIILFVC